jgi:hypothetical protein
VSNPTGRREDDLTISPSLGVTVATAPSRTPPPASHRFATGAIIAGRYRLVASLGRGGMGEVYRADDLTLDHPVALKFLAAASGQTASDLALFHNELRTARQVSHKNVCRLYDLGEADGRRFLTMEYVDGEDLASLLRRIGRIPQDKAIELARQLCAGLAAAHERGVLHRDLKPANVMIDGDGNVRITDFGLAVAAAGSADAALAGTPQYMAPEQLNGQPASVKSDIYALGLVLFEIFTGRRAYDAKTLTDLVQLHKSGVAVTPSSIVRDLDPAVERIVMRCLDRDPDRRPASALVVAAALPGANPLAEALAAGETPSPELLVAAGEADAVPASIGLAIVLLVLGGLLASVPLAMRGSLTRLGALEKPPAVLVDRAEQVLAAVGYTEPHVDTAYGFSFNNAYLTWIARTDPSPRRWAVLANGTPSAVVFWYRTSPRPMMSTAIPFAVTVLDPPSRETDARLVEIDARGRLIQFRSTPIQYDPNPLPAGTPPWRALFDAAGLTMPAFRSVSPQWAPPDFADTRAAWEGPLDGRPDVTIRVEAAMYRNRAVYFVVLGPWNQATRMLSGQLPRFQSVLSLIYRIAIIALLVVAVILARRNARSGRADMRGATRFAVFAGSTFLAGAIVGGHHVTNVTTEYSALALALEEATWQSIVLWTVYLALEPYGRKFWPDMLLGWSRLLSGHVRDARVGREVLAGTAFGMAFVYVYAARTLLPPLLGYPAPRPGFGTGTDVLLGHAAFVHLGLLLVFRELGVALLTTLVFVVCRLLTRRTSAAIALGMVVMFYAWSAIGAALAYWWVEVMFELAAVTILAVVTIRFGLLASAVALFVAALGETVPLTFDAAHWSAVGSNWAMAVITLLVCFGFYASRAGQPLFGSMLAAE